MAFRVQTLRNDGYDTEAAAHIAAAVPAEGSLVLTGGSSAERVYPLLAREPVEWSHIDVFFSDERCVRPDDAASNFGMAQRTLLAHAGARRVHRMRGEDPPEEAAAAYHEELRNMAGGRFDLVLLGMGADNHIAGMFPGSPALSEGDRLCLSVARPDGMRGLTLTAPAITPADSILVLATGRAKSEAVTRAIEGTGDIGSCPVLLLADHPDVTFLLDDEASSGL
jgi:6-phosphogluconolactonase